MKKLVIKEIINEQGKVTHIQIIKQTHRLEKFGDNNRDFFRYNNFTLQSCSFPDIIIMDSCEFGLYVRGEDTSTDNRILQVPSQEWLERMRKCVAKYNKINLNCDGCVDRHCNTCAIKDQL